MLLRAILKATDICAERLAAYDCWNDDSCRTAKSAKCLVFNKYLSQVVLIDRPSLAGHLQSLSFARYAPAETARA